MLPTVLTTLCLSFAYEVAETNRLIHQLGHDDFHKREAASTILTKTGPTALPFLEIAARNSPDPEIRRRAKAVTESILATHVFTDLDKAAAHASEHKKTLVAVCGPKPNFRIPDCIIYWTEKPDRRIFYDLHPDRIQVSVVYVWYETDKSGKRTLVMNGHSPVSTLGEDRKLSEFQGLIRALRGEKP